MIFKRKLKLKGFIKKYLIYLVAKGFKKSKSIDNFNTFTLVTRIFSIYTLIALTLVHNLTIFHMDFNAMFLNRELVEEIYVDQLKGCAVL